MQEIRKPDKGVSDKNLLIVVRALIIGLIFIGFIKLPNGYYTFLRFAVTIISLIFARKYYNENKQIWTWIFGTLAVVFNPLVPIELNKQIWEIIDFVTATIFLISIILDLHRGIRRIPGLIYNFFETWSEKSGRYGIISWFYLFFLPFIIIIGGLLVAFFELLSAIIN